ncbi:hypothetical protein PF002_g28126 [Phytophthora fragariae]|uniref:Retrotransposon gag domain-containing protein n=1 Tax=Phytophthora fragariae TaxID=53985 RepID=A0A6A3DV54_9STRA|nr:hypothetical protein PF009_g28116 [Phytophthora fragariae]KAE8970623.1 hypothetical protein PF011_g26347 [Phytophthora fragariae]KAE9178233.1 hypothetical protein PF002_g28126 [Phytophthora fragariae]KAE9284697.1 hypothetical protein PF008_g27093 [Phytophthora fragariae]
MARTRVVEVVVQQAKRAPDNRPANQNQEETKTDDPVDESNPSDERDEHGADETPSAAQEAPASTNDDGAAMAPVTALTAALQQMTTTMARIDARLDQLSTAVTSPAQLSAPTDANTQAAATQQPPAPTTNPPASTSAQHAPAAPVVTGGQPRDEQAATGRPAVLQSRDDGGDGGDSSDDDDSSDSSSDGNSDSDDGGRRRGRRQPVTRPGDDDFHRNRRRTIRDLDLPTFLPTPQTSVTTWIARVDLALEGARLSGRGDWTNQELYYILGNKLQDSAARWWVQLDRKLRDNERTWTKLKSALLQRYGERPDKAMAEWRVGQRRMMPGETYADFAAALRDLCGNNMIRERVLLAEFYRSLDRTTRLLVKQRPKPETPEEAVNKATEINDPIDNVVQGMENIGQAFVTAPDTYVVPANGTTGHMALIPGVGSTNVAEEEKLACFTNSRGFYNKYLGLWEAPKRRVWNGHMWAPLPRKRSATTAAPTVTRRVTTARPDKVPKVNMAVAAQDDSEEEGDDDQEAEADHAPPLLRNPSSQPDGRTP